MDRRNPVTAVHTYKKQKHPKPKKNQLAEKPVLFPMPAEKLRRYMGTEGHLVDDKSVGICWNNFDDYEVCIRYIENKR